MMNEAISAMHAVYMKYIDTLYGEHFSLMDWRQKHNAQVLISNNPYPCAMVRFNYSTSK